MRSRLDVLDGMRGFAIFLVVLYHETSLTGFRLEWPPWPAAPIVSFQWLAATGFVGVELFFFISGFCLFYPYARHVVEGARIPTLREFAYRRFIKIVPSYVLALTVLAFVNRNDFPNGFELAQAYLAHLFFVHPWWIPTFYSISGPFWTLGVEVQFYVLFPLIAAAFMRSPVLSWLVLSAVAVGYRSYILAAGLGNFTFYDDQLTGVIDLFATGMLGAYLYVRWRHPLERARVVPAVATALAVVAILWGAQLLRALYASNAILPQFGMYLWLMQHRSALALDCLAFALAASFSIGGFRETVANPFLVWLSVISYNLYLWHDGVIVRCREHGFPCALTPEPWKYLHDWEWRFLFGSLAISLAVASAVTYLLERPLLKLRPAWAVQPSSRGPTPADASAAPL
ncbi:MAG: acyltransferase [Candidatus Eremiobacteraeota bacterium]|nr:acyltransferase [Candidatus Eremiobacteraeota bacterium]